MIAFSSSDKVSGLGLRRDVVASATQAGVRFQQQNSTGCAGVAHEMNFPSLVLASSCNRISVQDSVFTDLPPAENLTPENMYSFNIWRSRSTLTWPIGPGIQG